MAYITPRMAVCFFSCVHSLSRKSLPGMCCGRPAGLWARRGIGCCCMHAPEEWVEFYSATAHDGSTMFIYFPYDVFFYWCALHCVIFTILPWQHLLFSICPPTESASSHRIYYVYCNPYFSTSAGACPNGWVVLDLLPLIASCLALAPKVTHTNLAPGMWEGYHWPGVGMLFSRVFQFPSPLRIDYELVCIRQIKTVSITKFQDSWFYF